MVELVAVLVIVILGILAAFAVPRTAALPTQSRQAADERDCKMRKTAPHG
jgi:type II secretory pathway pseudopilin PulG